MSLKESAVLDKDDIKRMLAPVLAGKNVEKAFLFGSYAAGKNTRRSDIDIMVVKKTIERFFDRYEQFSEVYDILHGYDVDLLIYNPEELGKISGRKFIKRILEEGELIYESGKS
ncbi:MAG: nucleotidyltransferase domain-containing protein [Fibrobacterota bacterium]